MKYKSRKTSKHFIQKCTKQQQHVGTLYDVTRHNPRFVHFLIPKYLVNLVPSPQQPSQDQIYNLNLELYIRSAEC